MFFSKKIELRRVREKTAAEVCRRVDLEDEGKAVLTAQITPSEFMTELVKKKDYVDAVRFLAQIIPKREAVWWASLCVQEVMENGKEPPTAAAALHSAQAWVMKPDEDRRRAAMAAAEKDEFKTPCAWAAAGAFWSGGSMAPPDAPVVPPDESLTGKAVAGAVMLAAVYKEPDKASKKYGKFIDLGVEIANGEKTIGGKV